MIGMTPAAQHTPYSTECSREGVAARDRSPNDPARATDSRLPSPQGAACRAHKGPDGEATPAEPRSPPQGPQPIGRECSPDMKRLAQFAKAPSLPIKRRRFRRGAAVPRDSRPPPESTLSEATPLGQPERAAQLPGRPSPTTGLSHGSGAARSQGFLGIPDGLPRAPKP
jgi:hypothetical protein